MRAISSNPSSTCEEKVLCWSTVPKACFTTNHLQSLM
jgi:hypothetical protein